MAEKAEQELLAVERENVVKLDKMEIIKIPNSEEVKVTVIESEITRKV